MAKISHSVFLFGFISLGTGCCSAATLVGSVLSALSTPAGTDQQSYSGIATRVSDGNLDTRGAVGGTLTVMSGQEVGNSSYNGIDSAQFSTSSRFNELNRFGADASNDRGGLLTYDFDLSTYLGLVTVGTAIGESSFTLDINYQGRRAAGFDGDWYISYNGAGLTLDTTNITTHTISGFTSGTQNADLVTTAANYKPVMTLAANTTADSLSVDITSDIATIAAGDGLIRLAYIEREFRGDITLSGASGIVETVVVPEPSASALLLLGLGCILSRRSR